MTASAALAYFVALLAVHWLGDFVLQTHWQSQNKSKRLDALAGHVAVYTAALLVGSALLFGRPASVAVFVLANCALHFVTDFFTSRITARLFGKDWHNFFVVVGFDQFLHHAALAGTFWLFILR